MSLVLRMHLQWYVLFAELFDDRKVLIFSFERTMFGNCWFGSNDKYPKELTEDGGK